MSVIMSLDVPGGTIEQYERTNELLGIRGEADVPDGLVSHACGETENGILIVDVWESQEALDLFVQTRLGAALHAAGMPEALPRIARVHNMVPHGRGTDARLIVTIELPAGPAVYDRLTARMDAHTGPDRHPAVSHAAGVTEDGTMLVADVWESREAFEEFIRTQVAPAAAETGLPPFEPRFALVHNHLRGRAMAHLG